MRRLVLLLVAGVIVLPGQRARTTPANGSVSKLLRLLTEETNPDQAARDVKAIWETDRWFTFPKFEETAKNVAAIMRRAGLEDVEIGSPPADGVTQGGFWTMPLAWDVKVGTLEIVEPAVPADQRVLADYQKIPASICMWSGPTPPGGVVTEVVLGGSGATQDDVKGKLYSDLAVRNADWRRQERSASSATPRRTATSRMNEVGSTHSETTAGVSPKEAPR